MNKVLARLLRLIGVLLLCAAGITGVEFFAPADEGSQQTPQPKYGDLQHLQFTATGELPVKLTFPGPGTVVSGAATQITAKTVRGAGVEVAVNGEIVPPRNLGKMTIDKDGTTQYDYYGVLVHPGPNTIVATAIGLNGTRGKPQSETIYGPGPAVAMHVSLIGSLVADGKSQAKLMVDAVDQWNNPAMPGSQVHASVVSGNVILGNDRSGSETPATPAPGNAVAPPTIAPSIVSTSHPDVRFQLLEGGRVFIPITAALQSGTVQVQVAIGNLTDTATFQVAPYLRAPFVNGVVSVAAGSVPVAVDGDGRYDGAGARKARVALYASGKVGRASALTLSYESQNRLQQSSVTGPFVADPNERPYQTYGDTSTVTSDFHSRDRLFARIDNGRNNLMWGQYQTAVGDPAGLAAYQRQVSGIKGEIGIGAPGSGRLMGFNARDDNAYISLTAPVSGLATLFQSLHPNIVIGSDRIMLVALDRRTGVPVSQTQESRNVDYTIDYATGTLRFINVPLPFDYNFNPQVLYIQYEYSGPGVKSQTTGFDFRYAIGRADNTKIDLGYINDATGSYNYSLATQTIDSKLRNGEMHLSHAMSSGGLPAGEFGAVQLAAHGSATAFSLAQRFHGNELDLNYQSTAPGFANPFGGFNTTGLENVQATFSHRSKDRGGFSFSASQVRNIGAPQSSVQQTVTALWDSVISNTLAVTLGMQASRQTMGPGAITPGQPAPQAVNGSTAQMQAGLRWKPTKRTLVNLERQATIGGNQNVLPSQTSLEFDYELPKQGRLYLRELMGGAVGSFANSTSTYTAPSIGSRSTQIGIQKNVSPNTAVDTSYVIDNAGAATNIYTTLGIQETFRFGKNLSGNAVFQNAHGTGETTTGFTVFGTALSYAIGNDFRSSFSMQTRGGPAGGTTMSLGAAGHIGPSIALVGNINETRSTSTVMADDRISLAFRPAENDRFISLLGFDRQSGALNSSQGTADILSFEEVYRPTLTTEIAGRLGYKLNGDGFYLAHSSVMGLRLTQDLGKRFDIGAEARAMSAGSSALGRTSDFATELGYKAPGGTRIAGGYNFSGSVDPTLTGHPVRKGFYVTVTTLIDRIFGWGKP